MPPGLPPVALLALAIGLPASSRAPEPISARASVGRGPFYVGQEVGIQVVAIAGGQRPEIEPPTIAGATLTPAGTGVRPLSTSAIGDTVLNEANAFAFTFRLVPERPGTLTIPPFRLIDGPRRGSTAPLRVEVQTPPLVGRPPSFAGGVGPLAAGAEVVPNAVRVGQPVEFRIRLEGPGARGTTRLPTDLDARLEHLPIAPEVVSLPPETNDEPPARTFRLRLRPTRPGETSLPPVLISWFDPTTRRYQTVATPAVPLRVVDVPGFDPSHVAYGPPAGATPPAPEGEPEGRWSRIWTSGLFWVAWLLPLAAMPLLWTLRSRRRRDEPARLARHLARHLAEDPTGVPETASRVVAALAEYLNRAASRPEGVLTPEEARHAISRLTADPDLAERAAHLVARCDRARFAAPGSDRKRDAWPEAGPALLPGTPKPDGTSSPPPPLSGGEPEGISALPLPLSRGGPERVPGVEVSTPPSPFDQPAGNAPEPGMPAMAPLSAAPDEAVGLVAEARELFGRLGRRSVAARAETSPRRASGSG